MSADTYRDCPKCKGKESVRIDGVWDFDLKVDGTFKHTISGKCESCGIVFV